MAKLIDGKVISAEIRAEISLEVQKLKEQGITPGLAVVLVGNDRASQTYVNMKEKACKAAGIYSEKYTLPENTHQDDLFELVNRLNHKKEINGILVQLPLPDGLEEGSIIETIDPWKDVDAFHPSNVGRIMIGNYRFVPCTPAGIMEMLHREKIPVAGKNCVVLGRSNIVGKPMAMLLMHDNGTVTVCHSKTKDLSEICRNADILIAAVGKPKFVTADMVKAGACVIDVGMDRDESGKLCGDVDFESVKELASYITPVPGGVGPMTISMLLRNTVTAAKIQNAIPDRKKVC